MSGLHWRAVGAILLATSQFLFFASREVWDGAVLPHSLGVLAFGLSMVCLAATVPPLASQQRRFMVWALWLGLLTGVTGGLMGHALDMQDRGAYSSLAFVNTISAVATPALALWHVAPYLRKAWWASGALAPIILLWANADGGDGAWFVADCIALLLPGFLCLVAAFEPLPQPPALMRGQVDFRASTQVFVAMIGLFAFGSIAAWKADWWWATNFAWEFGGMLSFLAAGLLAFEFPGMAGRSRHWALGIFACMTALNVWLEPGLLPPRRPFAVELLGMLTLPTATLFLVLVHRPSRLMRHLAACGALLATVFAVLFLVATPPDFFVGTVAWAVFQALCLAPGALLVPLLIRPSLPLAPKNETAS